MKNEWRPIESAPTTDDLDTYWKYILLWNGYHVGTGAVVRVGYGVAPIACDERGEQIDPVPTHWMPLPEPPEGDEK